MTKVLILYTSREGQTKKIAAFIQQHWQQQTQDSVQYECQRITPNMTIMNLSDYQFVLIGSSIRYGHYHPDMLAFTQRHAAQLNQLNSVFFGVNLVARKPDKQTPETNAYTRKFLSRSPWQPKEKAVFAGALLYPRYGFLDRFMIGLIMRLTKGETDKRKEVEYTDWQQVMQFSHQMLRYFYTPYQS